LILQVLASDFFLYRLLFEVRSKLFDYRLLSNQAFQLQHFTLLCKKDRRSDTKVVLKNYQKRKHRFDDITTSVRDVRGKCSYFFYDS